LTKAHSALFQLVFIFATEPDNGNYKLFRKAVDPAEKLRLLSQGDKSEVIRDKRSAKSRKRDW
jgi:hypothetical protein